ncbi:hypothetical protein C8R43DRAFT_1129237 [Mycena crocata]|nr:hypothetical protein C8R43DRAFT_1129237 [Mycena crocata]
MAKRKQIGSHYDFPDSDDENLHGQTLRPGNTENMLRQSTQIEADGSLQHGARIVPVPASPTKRARDAADVRQLFEDDFVHPDAEPVSAADRNPVYEQPGGLDSDDEEGGRALRDSDDPLAQWVKESRADFLELLLLLEGRADHRSYSICASCSVGKSEYRCNDCMSGGEMVCKECLFTQHARHPLHRVQFWNGMYFEKKSLAELGMRVQLGHWVGRHICLLPERAPADDFVIIDEHAVHEVLLDFCGCGKGGSHTKQLMLARLYPATVAAPRTAATFNVMDRFELLAFESKCSAYEFYHSLARGSDNTGLKPPPDRYHEFRRMTREWNNLDMLKKAGCGHNPNGIEGTAPGGCGLLCPACPQPNKNLDDGWQNAAEEKQFLYALFLALDANFRLKRKDVSTEEKDPGLGDGLSFYGEVTRYMAHVREHWDEPQERSTCVSHDAVDKPDREARGTASSGIGAVDCTRHNLKRPLAVGDLQLGERYINMDYMFFQSIAGTELLRFVVSYDIACQWHLNIWKRMQTYTPELRMREDDKRIFVTFLVPKFHLPAHIESCNLLYSFNLTRDVGQTDGEAPERGWANINPLAGSTKEMGPGACRDCLNEHFNDWNWKKIIAFGRGMLRKTRKAVPEMVATKVALDDMEQSLRDARAEGEAEAVAEWTKMMDLWEKDAKKPNPFETMEKDDHLAKVRRELAEEAAKRVEGKEEDEGDVVDEMHVTEMIAMGLQLEEHQRTLGFDMADMGQHPTDDQRRGMVERTSKLRRKIESWMTQQERFIPRCKWLRRWEHQARVRAARTKPWPGVKVQDIKLWLPSAMLKHTRGRHRSDVTPEVQKFEYRLRVGEANEALHDIRRHLLVRTHLYKYKDKHLRGVRDNMRSKQKIEALEDRIRRAAAQYRTARLALLLLGKALGEHDWERTLKELKDEDIRARPRSTFSDPERQRGVRGSSAAIKRRKIGRKKRVVRPLSWIWISQTKAQKDGEPQAMNEALRIEWAKARARRLRWCEEVDLLEEEMRRILKFLTWWAGWWTGLIGQREWMGPIDKRKPLDDAQREGETAYAARQAALRIALCESFADKWSSLPDLIRRGRAGEDVSDVVDEWEDVDEDSDVEDEPIAETGVHPVKSTYVDV